MTEFEARRPPYDSLTSAERRTLIERLTGLMALRVRTRVYTCLIMPEYRTSFRKDGNKRIPYTLCALGCLARVNEWVRRYGNSDAVAYIFERGGLGRNTAFYAFDEIIRLGYPEAALIGSRTVDDKHRPPLQAADIWAYEVRKYFVHQLTQPQRPLRKSLRRILRIPDSQGYVLGGHKLKALIEEIKAGGHRWAASPDPFSIGGVPVLTFGS
jgi:hypothetical protein